MRDLLFNVPWYLPTLLAIIGLALFVRGNRRQKPPVRTAGVAVIGLAILWGVVSYLVDTPKEICERQTREYVRAVADQDWKTFDRLMEPGVKFTAAANGNWEIAGRDTWAQDVKSGAQQIGLKSVVISDLRVAESGDTITTTIRVYSTQDLTMDRPVDSDWELDWRPAGDKWLLHELRALRVTGASLDQVRGTLRKH
ncbi:MAG TPA: DUF4440 domain-containing protein [Tepidisphaeraceae bacterium]|jgi:hypothetical protein